MIRPLLAAMAAAALAVPAIAQDGSGDTPQPSYDDVSEATGVVTDAYFAAYISLDWDTLETLLAEDASFEDTTATLVFGPVLSEGRTAMMQRYRIGYAAITHMEFVTDSRMVSGPNGVYQGALHWGLDLGGGLEVDSVTPMVIVLTVEDGKIVRHEDYLDYAPFLRAIAEAQSAAAEAAATTD